VTRNTHDRATSHFGGMGTDLVDSGTRTLTAVLQELHDRVTYVEDHRIHRVRAEAIILGTTSGSFAAEAWITT